MTIEKMRNSYCHAHCPCDGRGPVTSLPPSPLRASSQTSPNARQQSHTDNNFNKEDLRGKGIDVREMTFVTKPRWKSVEAYLTISLPRRWLPAC